MIRRTRDLIGALLPKDGANQLPTKTKTRSSLKQEVRRILPLVAIMIENHIVEHILD
jgi:hypothetical protein